MCHRVSSGCDAVTLGNIVVSPLVLNKIPSKRDSDSEENTSKYIVPALRQRKVLHSTNQRGILGSMPCSRTIQGMQKPAFRDPSITRIVIEEMPANLIPSDEVEPCFRTPSNYYKFSQKSKLTWRSHSFIMVYYFYPAVCFLVFLLSPVRVVMWVGLGPGVMHHLFKQGVQRCLRLGFSFLSRKILRKASDDERPSVFLRSMNWIGDRMCFGDLISRA